MGRDGGGPGDQPGPAISPAQEESIARRLLQIVDDARLDPERLFLAWKSQGWDLEASGLRTPARVGRLVRGLVLATWWRVALALPVCLSHLAALSARAARRLPPPDTPLQWPLPGLSPGVDGLAPPASAPPPARPWAAKFSLFTWGVKVIRATACRSDTPALCWTFPFWEAPVWFAQCAHLASPAA